MSVQHVGGLAKTVADIFDSLATELVLRTTFVHYLIAFCSRPEATGDVISGKYMRPVVLDNHVKFGDPRLNRSREIPPEPVWCGIFGGFLLYLPTGSSK